MYVIYFIKKNLIVDELNYTVTKTKFLGVVYALNKFQHYITGYFVFSHANHVVINYLMNKPIING
jgi:hypothetical protein